MTKAAIWLRVSTTDQQNANQLGAVEQFAEHHGYDIARWYEVEGSAYSRSADYKAALATALQEAHEGEFQVLIVWALDRLTRSGAEDVLRLVREFRSRGVVIVSVQESWLSGSPEIQDVLLAFAGWMGQQESARRSERAKAAVARKRSLGEPVGRQLGARDSTPRKRSGYVARWEKTRARA